MQFDNVYNVGVNANGILYNSYLVKAEKNVLIDTVPAQYSSFLINNIIKITDIKSIDYIVLNHTQSDRSGAVKALLEINPDAIIVSTVSGLKNLKEQLNCDFNELLAKSNMILELDTHNSFQFIITHNINWPDSMMTYYFQKSILFSCDAFSDESLESDMKKYYDDNLSYLSEYVYNAVNMLTRYEIHTILPGSGEAVFDVRKAINNYLIWARPSEKGKIKIAVIYESVSGNTKLLAQRVKNLIKSDNAVVNIIDAGIYSVEEILEYVHNADGVIFASPTEYRNITKKLSAVIMSLNHFKCSNKIFAAFGSYGWSGEAPNLIYSYLRARHFETFKSPFRYLFTPDSETIKEFDDFIMSFYEKITENK